MVNKHIAEKSRSKHAIERGFERYNLELDENAIKVIKNQITKGDYLFIKNSDKDKYRKFAYVKYKKLPIKILFYRSKSGKQFEIITIYPFDPDEYNKLLEEKLAIEINDAIKLLKSHKYIVYRRKDKEI